MGYEMENVLTVIESYNAYIAVALAVVCIILFIWNIVLSARIGKVMRRKNAKIADGGIEEIINAINEQDRNADYLKLRISEIIKKQDEQEICLKGCLQKIGIVRFNAFTDVAGEQSVALALLDTQKNGIILNILNSRQGSGVYAKAVTDGNVDRALTAEESEALEKALSA